MDEGFYLAAKLNKTLSLRLTTKGSRYDQQQYVQVVGNLTGSNASNVKR